MFWTGSQQVASVLEAMAEARHAEALRIGGLIAQLREKQGWSQEDLAHEVHVSVATVSRWERGLHKGLPANARRLAEALNVDPSLLSPAELNLETQMDRIEAELSRQGEVLDAVKEALAIESEEAAARAAKRAKQQAPGTPGVADRRRRA